MNNLSNAKISSKRELSLIMKLNDIFVKEKDIEVYAFI